MQLTSNISTTNSSFFNYSEKVQKNACSSYELSNHLGNVLAVITDRRIQTCGMGDVMHYEAQVVSISDYYPFGMGIKDREWKDSTFSYRFGFGNAEKDDEVSGEGNNLDFGARIYDSRLGRWLSVDPLWAKYPEHSNFSFAGNSPICFYDIDGREIIIYYKDIKGTTQEYKYTPGIPPTVDNVFVQKVHEAIVYNMHTEKGTEVWSQLANSDGVLRIHEKQAVPFDKKAEAGKFVGGATELTKDKKRLIGDIYWDPDSKLAALYPTGSVVKGTMTPSTSLLHEAGHGQKYDQAQLVKDGKYDIIDFENDNKTVDPDFETKEEKRNMIEVEHPYIKQINEWEQINAKCKEDRQPSYQPIRLNHRTGIWSTDNTSNVNINSPEDSKQYLALRSVYKIEDGESWIDDGISGNGEPNSDCDVKKTPEKQDKQ